ncbi:MAG: hypothetical protein AB7T49_05985 [Oligoflexales bacterium]
MRRIIALLISLVSSVAWAGPGNVGGNPSFVNLKSGYMFKSPFPTAVNISNKDIDIYEYGLQGYILTIQKEEYTIKQCVSSNRHKTVCSGKFEAKKATGVVKLDDRIYRITVTSDHDNEAMLRDLFLRISLDIISIQPSN